MVDGPPVTPDALTDRLLRSDGADSSDSDGSAPDSGPRVLAVAPPKPLIRAVIDRLGDDAPDGSVRLLLTSDGTAVFDEFLAASTAADAVAAGRLSVRVADAVRESVTVTADAVFAHVAAGDDVLAATTTDAELLAAMRAKYGEAWAAADPYDVGVPGRTALLDSFAERWPDAAATLRDALDGASSLRRGDELDPVAACTLVAARHELLTMHLGEWAGDVGFSSRTEISRAKERLVAAGVVDTERIPDGVGRPRQRLVLADDELADVPAAALFDAARDRLDDR
ncbi:transcriptional regulator TbsP domain-containing protein [Halobaculum sp. P14]|uniref:transcriptional regulator TbsP domain-containing protein n=1 Tax=Halobaculum sp. P14 TaxID=3421638 RepID=UPI003EB8B0D4